MSGSSDSQYLTRRSAAVSVHTDTSPIVSHQTVHGLVLVRPTHQSLVLTGNKAFSTERYSEQGTFFTSSWSPHAPLLTPSPDPSFPSCYITAEAWTFFCCTPPPIPLTRFLFFLICPSIGDSSHPKLHLLSRCPPPPSPAPTLLQATKANELHCFTINLGICQCC